MSECLFCKISRDKEALIWENDGFAAFKDIHPKAATHVLVVPKQHIENLDELSAELSPGLVDAVQEVAKELGVSGGYSVRVNVGRAGGQDVDHLHAHVLAG